MSTGPIKLTPLFKERLWGGENLRTLFGKALPDGVPIGESWELADLPEGETVVAEGPLAGTPLRTVLEQSGQAMGFSPEQCQKPFGLLIKLLDAHTVLSVQVHPGTEACKQFPGARLKTECWYILSAEPEAVIYKGLTPGTSAEDVRQAVDAGRLEELMVVHPVKQGDFHHLQAGTIHALGAGTVVAEIQTPSDTTFRLYDWNRKDAEGNSRQLHIDQALASIDYSDGFPPPPPTDDRQGKTLLALGDAVGSAELLVACSFFSVVHLSSLAQGRIEQPVDKPLVWMGLKGKATLSCHGETVTVSAGDTVIVPNTPALTIETDGESEALLSCLGSERAPS